MPEADDELATLRAKVAALEQRPTAPPPKKPNLIGWLFVAAVFVFIGYVVLGALGSATATPSTVKYVVAGEARQASLTLQNATGGSEQMEVRLPFEREFEARPGQFVYISAQNTDPRGGRLTCTIMVDGPIWKQSVSHGRHSIASCSGAVGSAAP